MDKSLAKLAPRHPRFFFEFDPLMLTACLQNHPLAIASLAKVGAPLNNPILLRSPLSHAASCGSLLAIQALVALGVSPNASTGHSGETPMIAAAFSGQVSAMELLMALGAHVDLPDAKGCSPLHWAANSGSLGPVSWLLSHGADPLLANNDSLIPLMLAARKGHRENTALLARTEPFSLLFRDVLGNRATHHAAKASRSGAVLALAEAGADFNALNHAGASALMLAEQRGHTDAVGAVRALSERLALLAEAPATLPSAHAARL